MKLLVVEDEALLRHHLQTRLTESGHVVESVANAEEALYQTGQFNFDLAVIDLGLPGMGGLDLIRQLRSSGFTQSTIVAGPLLLDLNRKQATLDEQPLALTAYEYRILEYLMRHHQQVVPKDRLMEQLYPDDDERDPNVIEVLVGRLRRKLEGPAGFKPIDTVRGLGYLFNERCTYFVLYVFD